MYFNEILPNLPLSRDGQEGFNKQIIIHLIKRSISLLKYREVNDVEPYYCESLIHLDILFESWIIKKQPHPKHILHGEGIERKYQIKLDYSDENYGKLKETYIKHYKKLINIYLNKIDAGIFLDDYIIKEDGFYLPKNDDIREFVEYFYSVYKDIGNEIDDSVSR